ncbi:MAG: aquaporin [Bacteroidota bacterium]
MNGKALAAEFIGTFALVFVGMGVIAANHLTGGSPGLLGIAFAHGLTLAVFIAATGAISGGHLNPAITLGAFVAKKLDPVNAAGYIVAQCLGAVVAAFLITFAVPENVLMVIAMGTPGIGIGITVSQGLVTEIILTFFLMFVVYGTAFDRRGPKPAALFIGLTLTLDILMGGPISGAAVNPARHLGPALLGGPTVHFWLYWVGPATGAILASFVYKYIFEESGSVS